jgi:hypothetical protein
VSSVMSYMGCTPSLEMSFYSRPQHLFFLFLSSKSKSSKCTVSAPSLDYFTVSGKVVASSKHKTHSKKKTKVDPVVDVASPPLKSCLSERYDETDVYFISA